MNRTLTHIGLYIGVLLLAACSESTAPDPVTYYQVFTGKTQKAWIVTGITWTGDGQNDINYTLGSCGADDQYIFYANADRHYQATNGARKCDPSEPDIWVDDSWSFVNATASLTFIFPLLADAPLPFFVRSVTDSKMELEIFIDQDNKYSYRIEFSAVDGK